MKVYLAARYSRRTELCRYRTELEAAGHVVTARWLNGAHQIANDGTPLGADGESLVEGDANSPEASRLRQGFAQEDVDDIAAADALVAFTEEPRSGHSRGGRHVELGMAVGLGKRVIVIGPRENLFCWLDVVEWHPDPSYLLGALKVPA